MLCDPIAARPTRFQSGGSTLRQYVHVDDVAAALLALLATPRVARRVYNVSGGDYRPFSEVVDIVRGLFPAADIMVGDAPDPDDPPMGPLTIRAIAADIGWKPTIPMAEGLKSYADWLRTPCP